MGARGLETPGQRCIESQISPSPAHACALGAEGIVAKRRDRPYRSGRCADCRMALATAPILDSAGAADPKCPLFGRYRG